MTGEQSKKFLEAVEAAGIKSYSFDTDLGTHLYNGDHSIIKFVEADEMIYNIRDSRYGGSHNSFGSHVQVVAAWTEDIHETRVAGTHSQIKTLLEKLNVELTEEDLKIIVEIDNGNVDIIPETGDYNRFKPLTKKQYDALTPEEKEEYDAAKEADDKAKHDYIGQHAAASITLG